MKKIFFLLLLCSSAHAQVIGGGSTPTNSASIDAGFGSTRGSILERGSLGWGIVPPGTSGLPWITNGPGADPGYQALTAAGIAAATIGGGNIASNTVANSNLSNMAAGTVKCEPTTTGAPQDCAPVAADKSFWVSTSGNDTNSGLNPLFPKLTIQAAVNAAASAGVVYVGAGTYTLSSALTMQPGVRVRCNDGAIITQGNSANLLSLVDFATNTANGASLENCIVDGNRANNTDNVNVIMVNPRTANDVTIRGNTIRNSNGFCASTFTGVRVRYIDNFVTNCAQTGLAVITGTAFTASHCEIKGNRIFAPMGAHALIVANADYCTVIGNDIIGDAIGGPAARMNVSTSGTTVTWVSGPQFNTVITPGNFLIINGGNEFQVTSIASATSLTVSSTPGTLTNVQAAIGTGDLVSIDSSSFTIFANNHLATNISQGISLNTGTGGEDSQFDLIQGNFVQNSGEMCIGVQTGPSTTNIRDASITGNLMQDCGQAGTAATGGGNILAGINMLGAGTAVVKNLWVDSNYVRDDQGTPTVTNWLAFNTGVTAGTIVLGKNGYFGTVNNGVSGDVSSITLSAGWGTTATTSAIISQGDSVDFTVNSAGTGQANQPSATINKISTVPSNPPLIVCKETNSNQAFNLVIGEQASISAAWAMNYNGTPVATNFYRFTCKG